MDFTMDWDILKGVSNEQLIHIFNTFTNFNLYTCSEDWRIDKKYILKLKGRYGDVVVYWI